LVLWHMLVAPAVLLGEIGVRKGCLRVLVQILHVRVGGRAVDVEVVLLYVFAVVALVAGQAEKAFFDDGVAPVPQGDGEADARVTVRKAREAVLVPAVGARSGLVVGEVVPRRPAGAVVLADASPGSVAEVWPPALPVLVFQPRFFEADGFGGRFHAGLD